jgi:hypothetical protein
VKLLAPTAHDRADESESLNSPLLVQGDRCLLVALMLKQSIALVYLVAKLVGQLYCLDSLVATTVCLPVVGITTSKNNFAQGVY